MATDRKPNSTNRNNFVAKIYDSVDGKFKPIYQPPEATDKIRGVTYLSDEISDDNASTGLTASTPLAVKKVNDNANTRLSTTSTDPQTVAGDVTFNGTTTFSSRIEAQNGIDVPANTTISGNLNGNASTASALQTARNISIEGGATGTATSFDGSRNISIPITSLDASKLSGTIPVASIPASAQERVVTVADQNARFALTTSQVQAGDTVYQADTKTMYMVKDDSKLASADGYQEYSAGIASRLGSADVGSDTKLMYLKGGTPTASASTVGAPNRGVYLNGGTITQMAHTVDKDVPSDAKFTDTTYDVMTGATATVVGKTGLVPAPAIGQNGLFLRGDGTWQEAGKVKSVNTKTGDITLGATDVGALSITGGTLTGGVSSQTIAPSADNTYSLGSSTSTWKDVYANRADVTTIQSNTYSFSDSNGASQITFSGAVSDGYTLKSVDAGKTYTTPLADKAVILRKLGDDVGTVLVSRDEPIDTHIKIWVKSDANPNDTGTGEVSQYTELNNKITALQSRFPIQTASLDSNVITTEKIASGAITPSKLSSDTMKALVQGMTVRVFDSGDSNADNDGLVCQGGYFAGFYIPELTLLVVTGWNTDSEPPTQNDTSNFILPSYVPRPNVTTAPCGDMLFGDSSVTYFTSVRLNTNGGLCVTSSGGSGGAFSSGPFICYLGAYGATRG